MKQILIMALILVVTACATKTEPTQTTPDLETQTLQPTEPIATLPTQEPVRAEARPTQVQPSIVEPAVAANNTSTEPVIKKRPASGGGGGSHKKTTTSKAAAPLEPQTNLSENTTGNNTTIAPVTQINETNVTTETNLSEANNTNQSINQTHTPRTFSMDINATYDQTDLIVTINVYGFPPDTTTCEKHFNDTITPHEMTLGNITRIPHSGNGTYYLSCIASTANETYREGYGEPDYVACNSQFNCVNVMNDTRISVSI